MRIFRVAIAVGALTAIVSSIAPVLSFADTATPAQPVASQSGVRDFDFLVGEWRVHHRRVQADTHQWVEFDGTCSNRKIMDGAANVEEHLLSSPGGAYRALGLRSYDPKSGLWSIRWLDGRYPSGALDPPVRGRFENGVGNFYSDYTQDGKSMRVRFTWSHITPTSARWEQASSSDAGETWATNWIMEFQRIAAAPAPSSTPAQAATDPAGVHDFDFLRGDWLVQHRYLRTRSDRREWMEVDGMCSNGALMQGSANLEEHMFNMPTGATHAVALRSYDPKTRQWSIWWLDSRDPSGDLDPPVRGRFENGVGTFLGELKLDGRPIRMRFTWSHITPTSARWEQAYSSDAGQTWEPNWVMEFHRSKVAIAMP